MTSARTRRTVATRSFVLAAAVALSPLGCGGSGAAAPGADLAVGLEDLATTTRQPDLALSGASSDAASAAQDLGAPNDGGGTSPDGGVLQGVMLGAHFGPEGQGDPDSEASVVALETSLGRKLAIDSDYEDWAPLSQPSGFPDTSRLAWDKAAGRMTMISWRTDLQGSSPDAGGAGCAVETDITSGVYDTQLIQQATTIKSTGATVLVRWHYEMTDNDDDTCANGGVPVRSNYQLAGQNFVGAWQHIVTLFRAQGATNVQWVWAPSASLFTGKAGDVDPVTWTYFYPGNDYVDWIANDNYNKTNTPMSYADDVNIQNWYAQTSTMGKPLMQSETAAHSDPTQVPDPQTEWITTAHTALEQSYPAIRAFVWWDGEEGTYGLTGPGLAAFKAMAADPYFSTMP